MENQGKEVKKLKFNINVKKDNSNEISNVNKDTINLDKSVNLQKEIISEPQVSIIEYKEDPIPEVYGPVPSDLNKQIEEEKIIKPKKKKDTVLNILIIITSIILISLLVTLFLEKIYDFSIIDLISEKFNNLS